MERIFPTYSRQNSVSNLMKIRLVEAELFQEEGQKDREGEANIRFSQFCESSSRQAIECPHNSK